jgi:single-strand DNA-binding protein
MAKSINKVTLVGNIGKDPEVKFLPSGQAVANFGLATTESFKDKTSNDWQERTEWHNVVAYGKVAELIRDYAKKGSKLYVDGRLTTRSWDDKETKKKVYRTEVVVSDFVLMSGRGEGAGESSSSSGYARNAPSSNTASFDQHSSASQDDYAHAEITDDDIPF